MNYIDSIKNYKPINEQEEKDKELFLFCIDKFDDILTRKNVVAHLTSSAFVVNKDRTKTLMIYHNIYDTWAWTGGHMDGMDDLIYVAKKELMEETGVKNPILITDEIMALDSITVNGHIKRGKYVSSHLHLNAAFLFECDENEELIVKEDENSGVRWIDIDKIDSYVSPNDKHVLEIYKKILRKANIINNFN
ncbi:NUDIX hydrolase [Clostridium thermobutyricum]|uniref:NUDIX domain protein n=1 Tax=Clostridium thermobutyricum DSM 4928 TaxID=1121339 RepID=A0A1V4SYW2_9CLOT|nr:NUDIX hydrolase [Clostridium thermobutyricum]OPX50436.1 NUDIX domain protein [Clostridium thermobutyricum DSM 4928]